MSSPNILQQYIDYTINQEKLSNLCKSFTSALKSVDLHKAANIATQIRVFIEPKTDGRVVKKRGVISSLIEVMNPEYYHHELLLAECTWILCNIATDTQYVPYLVELEALHKSIELMRHPCKEVQANILRFLGNIAKDNMHFRDLLLSQEGVVDQIEWLLQSTIPKEPFTSNIAWLIANLTRGRPYPPFQKVATLAKYLEYLLKNTEDTNTLVFVLQALSNLSDVGFENGQLRRIFELDIWTILFDLVRTRRENIDILQASLNMINNMVSGDDDQVIKLTKNGFVELYGELIQHPDNEIRYQVYIGISNFLENGTGRAEQVFDFKEGEIVRQLIKALPSKNPDITQECLNCICCLCCDATTLQLYQLIKLDVIDLVFLHINTCSEEGDLVNCLDTLSGILEKFKDKGQDEDEDEGEFEQLKRSDIMSIIEKNNGFKLLKALETHWSPLNDIATEIRENYFDSEI